MRILLTDTFPPQSVKQQAFPAGADAVPALTGRTARTFSQTAVLASLDNLVEVGVDGMVIATSGALHVEQAASAPERGVALSSGKTTSAGRSGAEVKAGKVVA